MGYNHALDETLTHLVNIDAMGELPLAVRQRLRASLVHHLGNDDRALRFISLLGLACAKRAWPVWQTAFGSESRPMDLAEAVVSSDREGANAGTRDMRELMEIKTELDGKFLLGQEYFSAVCAGFASWAVVRDVVSQDRPECTTGDTELEISPEEWDPCFFASLAIAGGATWEESGRRDARREFWQWYLMTAVPQAFAAAAS